MSVLLCICLDFARMAPIPQWLLKDVSSGTRAGTSTSGPPNASANGGSPSRVFVEKFLPALLHAQTRECALQLLCKVHTSFSYCFFFCIFLFSSFIGLNLIFYFCLVWLPRNRMKRNKEMR